MYSDEEINEQLEKHALSLVKIKRVHNTRINNRMKEKSTPNHLVVEEGNRITI